MSATISITSFCHWAGPIMQSSNECRYAMKFGVQEMADDWLISGQKKGEFVAIVSYRLGTPRGYFSSNALYRTDLRIQSL